MKPILFLLLLATLASSAFALQPQSAEPDHPSLVFRKTVNPIFPPRLLTMGVADGEVRVIISVNSDGKLDEWLVIGYTHPGLVDSVIEAVKHFEFEPPRWHGEPVSIQRELKFNFENHGVVVTLDPTTFMETFLAPRFSDRYVFRLTNFKELDKIPTPLNATAPAVVKKLAAPNSVSVTVEFFIDQTGAVRMPSVLAADDVDFASSCVAAVRDWKFEPPSRQGKPVLVRVQQTFRFQP